MKKIFTLTLLLAVFLSAQFASAQKTLHVRSKSGELSEYIVNKVSFVDELFTFTYGDATVTTEMFSASFKVAFKSDEYKSFAQTPEVGICFSDLNENPTIDDEKIVQDSTLKGYTFSIYGLDSGTTYYYRAYVKVNDIVFYGDIKSVTTLGTKPTGYKIIDGHKFVDLGLPSGLLWATCNVGAATPADDGNYYAWGKTEPNSTCTGSSKYNSSDGKTSLDQEDDAAYVNWGSSCRMPTFHEFGELSNENYCTWTLTSMTTSNGSPINGLKVSSVKNGKSIFLPFSGYRDEEYLGYHGSMGYYWSSSLDSRGSSSARILQVYSDCYCLTISKRALGHTIRPVAEP